jgi:hypothetical protein
MKYFIRKSKDCISSFFACEGKNGGGGVGKKNYCVCVCDEWRGSARIGCWCKRGVEKMSKTSTLCRKAMKKKILKTKNCRC